MNLLSFYDKVDFSATILARLMIMGHMINLKVYISVRQNKIKNIKTIIVVKGEGRGATF